MHCKHPIETKQFIYLENKSENQRIRECVHAEKYENQIMMNQRMCSCIMRIAYMHSEQQEQDRVPRSQTLHMVTM